MTAEVDVAVVGAGIAGLTAADMVAAAGREVHVFEAASRPGGRMRTIRWNGFASDSGAEMIATHGYPATWRLIRRLGLSDQDAPRIPAGVAMWRDGRAHSNVGAPSSLVTGGGLSVRGRLALAGFAAATWRRRREYHLDRLDRTPLGAATVADLAAMYGDELGRYLFQPLVSGMFCWRPERSAAAPFVATMLSVRGPTSWRTYRDGMDTPARLLAARVPVHLDERVREVVSVPAGVRLRTDRRTLLARQALLCVPAPVALAMHANVPDDERPFLAACGNEPSVRVACPLRRPLGPHTRRPVHILAVPAAEDRDLAGFAIDHARHPGRAPAGRGLVTVVASPSRAADLLTAPHDEVADQLMTAADRYIPGLPGAAMTALVHRFRHGLPTVTPDAVRLHAAFLGRPARSVEYAGDWLMLRPSSEGAVRSAEIAVARLLARQDDSQRTSS